MPLHVRNAPRSRTGYLIIILNILAAMVCRLLLAIITMDVPWGEPDWTEDAAAYVVTKSSRRGLVFAIRFCTAYLIVFSVTVLAGFDWLDVDAVLDVWGPEDLRGELERGGGWFW